MYINHILVTVQDKPNDVPLERGKTMRFKSYVGKYEILILLDSCNATTFISDRLATQFQSNKVSCASIQYTTVDGSSMNSVSSVPQFHWRI